MVHASRIMIGAPTQLMVEVFQRATYKAIKAIKAKAYIHDYASYLLATVGGFKG